jgi:hypothetical protein
MGMTVTAPENKGRVVSFEIDGRTGSLSRNDLVRMVAGRQLATMVMWLVENVHRTDRGYPVNLAKNPQWREIYSDPSPDMRIMSSAQVGKSLLATLRIFAAAELGFETGFVMPTDPKRNEFVHNRIMRTLENTPYYKERIESAGGVDSVREKHYRSRDGTICPIHFVAAASDNELVAFTADQMMIDERDRCDRDNLKMYPSRMNQSDYRLTYECSTPTTPGYQPTGKPGETGPDNIHTEFLGGTQKKWHVLCDQCGLEQAPEWDKNVVKIATDDAGSIVSAEVRDPEYIPGGSADVRVMCSQCNAPLDRLGPGRWIKLNPKSRVTSYWVNRLCSDVGEPLSAILNRFMLAINNPSAMQQVYNMDLGVPFAGGFAGFREDLFVRCCGDYDMFTACDDGAVTAGIDVNVPHFDVHISRWTPENQRCPQQKLFAGKILGKENLYALLKRFRVRVAVIDQQPELNMACEIQRDAPRLCGTKIVRAKYSSHPTIDPITISEAGANPAIDMPVIITLDRTGTLDAEYQNMLNGQVRYFRNWKTAIDGRMLSEFLRPVRTIVIGEGGIPRWAWEGTPDHQLHAANLDRIAADKLVGRLMLARHSGPIGVRTDYTHARGNSQVPQAGNPEKVLNAMLGMRLKTLQRRIP